MNKLLNITAMALVLALAGGANVKAVEVNPKGGWGGEPLPAAQGSSSQMELAAKFKAASKDVNEIMSYYQNAISQNPAFQGVVDKIKSAVEKATVSYGKLNIQPEASTAKEMPMMGAGCASRGPDYYGPCIKEKLKNLGATYESISQETKDKSEISTGFQEAAVTINDAFKAVESIIPTAPSAEMKIGGDPSSLPPQRPEPIVQPMPIPDQPHPMPRPVPVMPPEPDSLNSSSTTTLEKDLVFAKMSASKLSQVGAEIIKKICSPAPKDKNCIKIKESLAKIRASFTEFHTLASKAKQSSKK